MTRLSHKKAVLAARICLCVCSLLLVVACSSTPPAPPDTRVADEAAVRKADTYWSNAVQSKQVDSWVAFYTDETVVLPPNDKLTSGKENVRKVVGELLTMPGLAISWQPSKVEVARSGDLAYTYGTYQMAFNDPKGKPMTDHGKYTEVWKKQADGNWKCVLDMWSSDVPTAPPPSKLKRGNMH